MSNEQPKSPLSLVNDVVLMQLSGLKDAHLAATLLQSRFLRGQMEDFAAGKLPPFNAEIGVEDEALADRLAGCSLETLLFVAHRIVIAINRDVIRAQTTGSVLTTLAAWCGGESWLRHCLCANLPAPEQLPPVDGFRPELLQAQDERVQALILGMLPAAYRARLQLRLGPAMPGPMYPETEAAKRALSALARFSLEKGEFR